MRIDDLEIIRQSKAITLDLTGLRKVIRAASRAHNKAMTHDDGFDGRVRTKARATAEALLEMAADLDTDLHLLGTFEEDEYDEWEAANLAWDLACDVRGREMTPAVRKAVGALWRSTEAARVAIAEAEKLGLEMEDRCAQDVYADEP